MMSGNSIRKRELQRKVLCSLLAAGVMSVCISGGGRMGGRNYQR